jgi:pimeloyl-ACP methyl ester carboxylesterase
MKHASAGGLQIAYDDLGKAPGAALLCLPGWCVSRRFFAPIAERLAERRRVLVLDWRGHGDSDGPAGEVGHTELLDDALAVLEASGAETVIPVGQAHGAWVGVELRRRLGARVRGVVATSWLVLDPPPVFAGVLAALQDPARWEHARDQLLANWTTGAPAQVREKVIREMSAYGSTMWARAGRAIAGEYARHGSPLRAMAELADAVPFLHVFSQPRAPEFLAAQEAFARAHPWFAVRRLDAVSHFPPLEAPDATAREIEAFIQQAGA